MRRWTLRSRLAAASAVAILVALALLGIAATLVVEDQLRGTVDRDLRRRAVDVAQLAALTPGLLEARGSLDLGSGGRQVWVEVRDRDGRIVARSDSLRARLLPGTAARERALRAGEPAFADDRLGDEPIRLYAAPLAATGGPAGGGTVVVASSMGDIEDIFGRLREAIALAALAAALLGGAIATVLTARGLRPLRRLAVGARAISEAPDLGRRLPAAATDDEVGELSHALNRMLDALDHAREAERRLLADASHELRTPVTSLRGNAAFARRHGADPELLADLEADAERLARLVEDLLALEREAGAELPGEEVELEAVVAAVVAAPGIELGESPLLDALAAADTGDAGVHGVADRAAGSGAAGVRGVADGTAEPGAAGVHGVTDGTAGSGAADVRGVADGTAEPGDAGVRGVADRAARSGAAGGPRVVVTETAPLVVRGQAGPLARALRNLVENACVHGPVDGEVRVSLTRRGDEAVLAVSDDGPGIPPEQAAAAPRRFWRGPDALAGGRPGSGLGLAIVAATAARHGGRLEIDGATVALALPLVRELSEPARTVAP